jgi:hypothetical protein
VPGIVLDCTQSSRVLSSCRPCPGICAPGAGGEWVRCLFGLNAAPVGCLGFRRVSRNSTKGAPELIRLCVFSPACACRTQVERDVCPSPVVDG